MVDFKGVSGQNIRAMKEAAKLGLTLQQEHPEIAGLYRKGLFQREIMNQLGLQAKYNASKRVVLSAISNHINGYGGELGFGAYDGSLEASERFDLARSHRQRNGNLSGSVYGPLYGQKTYEERIGVHGRSPERKKEDSLKSVVSRGLTPWSGEEITLAYRLSTSSDYKFQDGHYKGKTDSKRIAEFLNDNSHSGKPVRTPKAVKVILSKYRKSLESRASS